MFCSLSKALNIDNGGNDFVFLLKNTDSTRFVTHKIAIK